MNIHFKELSKQIKNGDIAGVYLFYGEEEFVKQKALDYMRAVLLPGGLEQMNETLLEGGVSSLQIVEATETLPFMGERRLVTVRDWPALLSGKSKNEAEESQRIIDYLDNLPATSCLIFYAHGNIDKRKKLAQALQKKAVCVEFKALTDSEIAQRAKSTLKSYGKNIDAQALRQLVFLAGRGFARLDLELNKLAAYVGDRTTIEQADVDALVAPSLESSVFQMIDELLAHKMDRARRLLKTMRESGESIIGILAMLTRHMRMMLHINLLKQQRLPLAEIERKLELSHFVAGRAAAQAQRFTVEAAQQGYRACIDADYAIKSGQIRDEVALDRVMLLIHGLS